jgi:hypothetical protein
LVGFRAGQPRGISPLGIRTLVTWTTCENTNHYATVAHNIKMNL